LFGIGVVVGQREIRIRSNPKAPLKGITWMETVAVHAGLVVLLHIGAIPGKRFIL
jgi:hypothetical protein